MDAAGKPFQALVKKLVATPDVFDSADVALAFNCILQNEANHVQIAAFLTALKLHKKDMDPQVIAVCANVMRARALKADCGAGPVLDIVGTGGDGQDTFNVSTTAAIVAAGAGCRVAKHGNRASTSSSGSSDILESFGCKIVNVTPENVPLVFQQSNFCFFHAPLFHPGFRFVVPVRKELGFPTIFNYVGPLVNPALPEGQVIGVNKPELGGLVADALKLMGMKRAMVVNGAIGLDEISPEGETFLWSLENGIVSQSTIRPNDFGFSERPLSAVKGGSPQENAETLRNLLQGKIDGPILEYVLMNTAALLVVSGRAKDFKAGVELARQSISSGNALKQLEAYRDATVSFGDLPSMTPRSSSPLPIPR